VYFFSVSKLYLDINPTSGKEPLFSMCLFLVAVWLIQLCLFSLCKVMYVYCVIMCVILVTYSERTVEIHYDLWRLHMRESQ
jgi:hypothetical protein